MDRELFKRAYDMLVRLEGSTAARAYNELHSPPFESGEAYIELANLRDLLADMQKALNAL